MTVEELALGFEKLLDGKKKVTIISHFNPDGDAVGSSVGLNWFLLERGHSSRIVLPSAAPPFLDFLDPEHTIIYYSEDKKRAKDAVNDCDIIVCLDFNKPERTEWMSDLLISAKADKVMIDHHPNAVREGFNIVISWQGFQPEYQEPLRHHGRHSDRHQQLQQLRHSIYVQRRSRDAESRC